MTFVSFDTLLAIVSVVAGGIASVAGFGIGSLLTPLFAMRVDMRTAVAAVSVPHVIGTAFRFWRLRGHVDRHVLLSFGITSAAGGLAGALLSAHASSSARRRSWSTPRSCRWACRGGCPSRPRGCAQRAACAACRECASCR